MTPGSPSGAMSAAIALVTKNLGPSDLNESVSVMPESGVEAGKLVAHLVRLAVDLARAGASHSDRTAEQLVQEVATLWQLGERPTS